MAATIIMSTLVYEWPVFTMEINLRALDLNLLRVSIAVWETRSISRAAAIVGMSQPATSNALARLRVATGDQLFVRSKSGMIPTAYAEMILPNIKHHLEGLFDIFSGQAAFDPQTTEKVFRLSLSGLGELVFLPRLLACALNTAPNIRLDNVQTSAANLGYALRSGTVDCAIGLLEHNEAGVMSQELFRETYVAVAGEGLADDPSTLEELRHQKLAISAPTSSYAAAMSQLITKHKLDESVTVKLANFGAIAQLLKTLPLVSILPKQFADQLAATGNIRILPIRLQHAKPVARLVWHERTNDDPACAWLRSLIIELFGGDL